MLGGAAASTRPAPSLRHVQIVPPPGSATSRIAYWDWPPTHPDGPVVVFLHATGFHARVFDLLVEHLPHCHCLCFDMPGHGETARLQAPAEVDCRDWRRRALLLQLAFEQYKKKTTLINSESEFRQKAYKMLVKLYNFVCVFT